MEEDIRKTTEQLLNRLKEEESKPKNIYEFETVVPNYILLPLKASTEELINKNKELEKVIEEMRKEIIQATHMYKKEIAEQQKMVELMAEYISNTDIDEDVCKVMHKVDKYGDCEEDCKECVIDYFRKKAKGDEYGKEKKKNTNEEF